MQYRTLGRTGLRVSRICLGTWQLGGDWGSFDEDEAEATVRAALDLGINFFDTAQAYGFGRSERLLGKALRAEIESDRESIVLATKGGLRRANGRLLRDASPECLRQCLATSLTALGTAYIDVYQVHWPDPNVPFERTARVLEEFVREGRVRHVGVSNFDVAQMQEFARTRPVDTLQSAYHMLRREIEDDVLPHCRKHDIGVFVYGPLAHGLLTGGIDPHQTFGTTDWRASSPLFRREILARVADQNRDLERIAAARGASLAQLAVAWTLAQEGVHAAIVGARTRRHLQDSAAAGDVTLTPEERAAIDALLEDSLRLGGPSPEGGVDPL